MAWKSYRGHAQPGEASPFGPVVAALCIVLALAAPWLLLAAAIAKALRYLTS